MVPGSPEQQDAKEPAAPSDEPLLDIEKEWIAFLSARTERPCGDMERAYRKARSVLGGQPPGLRELMRCIHAMYATLFDTADEAGLVEMYQFHALLHSFYFLSGAHPKPRPPFSSVRSAMKLLAGRQFRKLSLAFKNKVTGGAKDYGGSSTVARFLLDCVADKPVIVDYGCGFGHVSFEMGQLDRSSKIYLVDIECLPLEFACFRFRKHGLDVETIPVTPDCVYPELPPHNIYIATEVMEHVKQPLMVYENILGGLEEGGILHGVFADHTSGILHVSPHLGELRRRVSRDFVTVGMRTFRRRPSGS